MTRPNVDEIMRYEDGEMQEDEMVVFFQSLVDSGLAWQLQGHYGRTAAALIEAGQVTPKYEDDESTGLAGHPDGNGERW